MPTTVFIVIIGYLTGVCGFLPGILLSRTVDKLGRRVQGPLVGFTGGLLLAFICFEMLPQAFDGVAIGVGVTGMLAGVLLCAFTEKRIPKIAERLGADRKQPQMNTGVMLALGVVLHNIPEGIAVGALLNTDVDAGIKMALIIAVHCLPEAIAIALPLIKSGVSIEQLSGAALLFALPLCIGAMIGALLGGVSRVFISVCLGFAGGVMLYITCGEVLPDSRDLWRGRLTTIFATVGFIAGVLLTA